MPLLGEAPFGVQPGLFTPPSRFGTRQKPKLKETDYALADYREAAYAGQAEEERRGEEQEGVQRQATQDVSKPSLTQEEIDRQFGREANQSGRTMLDAMSALREYMGSSGIYGGGIPAGIAGGIELQRLAQLTQARGDLMAKKAVMDAQDRDRKFQADTLLGQVINRPISMLGIDFEGQNVGVELARHMASSQIKAGEQAGKNALLGGALGGAGALLGSFF